MVPRSAWAKAAVVAAALCGCDRPTGIVIDVRGARGADTLRVAVGADGAGEDFLPARETGTIKDSGPYSDGFEIYLGREALAAKGSLALVLDASIPGANGAAAIHRATYQLTPNPDELLAVQLTVSASGPGQWVCAGQPGESGFTISEAPDCDRDGWGRPQDPDDANPFVPALPARVIPTRGDLQRCSVALGDTVYEGLLERVACGGCVAAAPLETCFDSAGPVECRVFANDKELPLRSIMEVSGTGHVTLASLTPARAAAYFVPSKASLRKLPDANDGEWLVAIDTRFAGTPYFLVSDGKSHTLVKVEIRDGDGVADCKPKQTSR